MDIESPFVNWLHFELGESLRQNYQSDSAIPVSVIKFPSQLLLQWEDVSATMQSHVVRSNPGKDLVAMPSLATMHGDNMMGTRFQNPNLGTKIMKEIIPLQHALLMNTPIQDTWMGEASATGLTNGLVQQMDMGFHDLI